LRGYASYDRIQLTMNMSTNINITPHKNENPTQALRRFTNAFREASILQTVKGNRYFHRLKSERSEKDGKLRRIKDAVEYKNLRRNGKIN